IAEIDKVRLPYNINSLTQASAAFFIKHFNIFEAQAAGIRDERSRLYQSMATIDGIETFPSAANFLLFRVHDEPAVFSALRVRGILIKSLHHADGLLSGCLRVTIGKPEENDAFLTAIKEILA
ncbi:MAG: histidinol-phosphate transaminase, partial [Mariprofundaceae bacterium]